MVARNGQQLGNYRLIQRLGGGRAAEVYLGEHIFLNTLAAIKIFQVPLLEQDTPAYLREAHAIAGLTHPNIVRVLEFGVQDEKFFLLMEYVPGDTLRQNYTPSSRLSPAYVVSLVNQIADALQYAHDHNIIHCNLKPENILLGQDNEVLVSDFGISTVLQTMNSQQVQPSAGTMAYIAPEQFDGKPQRASDQYALAVITYEWLSGEHPFQNDIAATSGQHLHTQAAPLSGKVPGISPAVDEVLNMAMEKDPARRFSSIRAFARALEQACNSTPVEAIPTISEESPAWLTTVTPALILFPTPSAGGVAYQLQDMTLASGPNTSAAQRDTDADRTPEPYRVQPVLSPFQPEQRIQPEQRAPGKNTSRRAFLVGIGGGAIVVGGVVVLVASGKLASLFAQGSATPTHTPGGSVTPRTTSTLTARPTQAQPTSTSKIPLGTTLTTYTGQSSDVTGVCWSPTVSSRMVASCSRDGSALIWNATTGEVARTFPQSGPLNTLVWSPNGQYIAFAGDASTVEVWDAASGNLISTCTEHTQPILGLAWSPNSQHIVSTSQDHSAIVWDATTGSQLITFTGHSDYVWVAAWAPNGSSIATGSWDSTVQIWDPNTGSRILRYTATQPVRAVDWSPDSSLIASGGNDGSVQVWQAASGNVLTTYRGHSDHIETVQWSPNGQRIASASKDATAQIWQVSNASRIYTYRDHSQLVWSLAWSPDGQLIVSGSQDHTAKVWQAV